MAIDRRAKASKALEEAWKKFSGNRTEEPLVRGAFEAGWKARKEADVMLMRQPRRPEGGTS